MLTILGNRQHRFCDGMSRRGFLRIGSLGLGSLGLGGLSMPRLLRAECALQPAGGQAIEPAIGHHGLPAGRADAARDV